MNIIRIIMASIFMTAMSALIILTAVNLPYEGLFRMFFYEGILLGIALTVIGISWIVTKQRPELLQMGSIDAKGKRNQLFLIKDRHSWLRTGITFAVTITAVTSLFMIMGMAGSKNVFSFDLLLSNLHWILLFSMINAFGEEVLYRIIPYEIMKDAAGPNTYSIFSGIFFGLAHLWGNPGGPAGVMISGLLGFFLARSAVETKGSFWAILIHALQDIVIFGVLFSFGMLV